MGIPGSSFFGWEEGAIKDAANEALTRHGGDYTAALQDIRIGNLEKGYGANNDNVTQFLVNKQRNAINSNPQLQQLALEAGAPLYKSGGFANQGDSLMQTQSKLKGLLDAKTEDKRQLKRTEGEEDRNAIFGQQSAMADKGYAATALQGTLNRDAAKDQYLHSTQMQENRYAHEKAEGRLDRRQQLELAMLSGNREMQVAEMNSELADKRMDYDRETRSMDKRDRMIAQLMSGLGSLGSAFG